MEKDKYRGYIVEDDRDGDSDGFHRNVIKRPDGTVVRDGVYDYCLMAVINSLPDLTVDPDRVEVKFEWKRSSNKPDDHLPLVCMTDKGSIITRVHDG